MGFHINKLISKCLNGKMVFEQRPNSQPRALPEGWIVGCEIWWGQVYPCRNLTFSLGLMRNYWGLSRLEEIWCWSTFERTNSAYGTERLEVQTVDRRLWLQLRWERQVIWTRIRGNSSRSGLILDILCMQCLMMFWNWMWEGRAWGKERKQGPQGGKANSYLFQ